MLSCSVLIGQVRYVSPRREGSGSNTPSRGRVVAGWNFGASLESTPVKNWKSFFLSSFSFRSLFDICFGNGTDLCSLSDFVSFASMETVKSSLKAKRKMVKASLMLVNRTLRRKKFLELTIWEVSYRRKRDLMNVDKQHVLQQLCSVSVDFQQLEGSISLLKKT